MSGPAPQNPPSAETSPLWGLVLALGEIAERVVREEMAGCSDEAQAAEERPTQEAA